MAENPAGFRALSNSGRRPAPGAVRVAAADPKESLSVSIRVRPQPGGPAPPDVLAYASKLPGQRQYLSREEYAARHGAAPADLDQVTAFAQSHGLRITESSAARRTVVVSGTVEQMNKAFGVDLGPILFT